MDFAVLMDRKIITRILMSIRAYDLSVGIL